MLVVYYLVYYLVDYSHNVPNINVNGGTAIISKVEYETIVS